MRRELLESLYRFITRRSKPVRLMGKVVAQTGISVLSKIRKFDVSSDLSLADYHMLLGTYEPGTAIICQRLLRPGMTAVDVGAHVGYYTRLFARLVGPSGKVYAFEPHPDNFVLLKRNIQRFRQVVPIQMAVTDAEKETVLYESSVGSGSHSLLASRYPYLRQIPVKAISLDGFLRKGQVDLVKIDVEGGELEVLRGMQELISRSDSLALIVEFYPPVLSSRRLAPRKLLDTLAELGFEIYAIEESRGQLTPLTSWQSYELFIDSIRKHVNLFAQKKNTQP